MAIQMLRFVKNPLPQAVSSFALHGSGRRTGRWQFGRNWGLDWHGHSVRMVCRAMGRFRGAQTLATADRRTAKVYCMLRSPRTAGSCDGSQNTLTSQALEVRTASGLRQYQRRGRYQQAVYNDAAAERFPQTGGNVVRMQPRAHANYARSRRIQYLGRRAQPKSPPAILAQDAREDGNASSHAGCTARHSTPSPGRRTLAPQLARIKKHGWHVCIDSFNIPVWQAAPQPHAEGGEQSAVCSELKRGHKSLAD